MWKEMKKSTREDGAERFIDVVVATSDLEKLRNA